MKRIIARKELELDAMRDLTEKKRLGPSKRKDAVRALRERGISQRAACHVIGISTRDAISPPPL